MAKLVNLLKFLKALPLSAFRFVPVFLSLLFLTSVFPIHAWAAGTIAGSTISNTATVNYSIGPVTAPPVTSLPATFQVDELIQPILTWQDGGPVAVNPSGINGVLTFMLTNSGNGQEAFSLSRINGPLPLPAGNYTPLDGAIGSIYLESNAVPGFQPTDTAYVAGANDPDLAPDAGQIIYVISNTPAVADNAQGEVQLNAASLTPGAAGALPGTSFAGLGQGGSFAVVGGTNAQSSATGSYIVTGLNLAVTKSVLTVLDPNSGTVAMPGSIITYQLVVSLTGNGTAANLVINDPLPAETTYVANSINVDGTAKTDAIDADNAQFSTNTVSVSLGDVAAPANIVITFRATIN